MNALSMRKIRDISALLCLCKRSTKESSSEFFEVSPEFIRFSPFTDNPHRYEMRNFYGFSKNVFSCILILIRQKNDRWHLIIICVAICRIFALIVTKAGYVWQAIKLNGRKLNEQSETHQRLTLPSSLVFL